MTSKMTPQTIYNQLLIAVINKTNAVFTFKHIIYSTDPVYIIVSISNKDPFTHSPQTIHTLFLAYINKSAIIQHINQNMINFIK